MAQQSHAINPTHAKYENVSHCLAIGVQEFKTLMQSDLMSSDRGSG